MVAALEQIQANLNALRQTIAEVAEDLCTLYANYLKVLGRAVCQQLILACYHLCTQDYPQAFLRLSLSQRQELQQTLQNLGQQTEQRCQDLLDRLPTEFQTLSPEEFSQAQELLEEAIAEPLTTLSRQANQVLQDYGILPPGELDLLLEVAAKAEATSGPITAGPPNILTALIEKGDAGEAQETPLKAIYLRLSEIEFADATTMAWRNQIRKRLSRLSELQREFALKQQERTIAEAEAAWRACWIESQR